MSFFQMGWAFGCLLVCWLGAARAEEGAARSDAEQVFSVAIHDLPPSYSPLFPPFQAWFKNHPNVRPASYSKLNIKTMERGSLMMAIAGGSAPDLLRVYHHEARAWIRNGFFEPLDRYIYPDTEGDGLYTHGKDEVLWKPFLRLTEQERNFVIQDGHIYILPRFQWIQHLIYRKDLFIEAGIDPEKQIKTFDELIRVCRKITDPEARIPGARNAKGRHGFGLWPNGWIWQGWLYACGGSSMYTLKYCSVCKADIKFPQGELRWRCPDCNQDLSKVPGRERAALDTPEAHRALDIWQTMLWAPYVKCHHCQEPIEVKKNKAAALPLKQICPRCGKSSTITNAGEIIEGCARACVDEDGNWQELWRNGEIAITNYYKVDWLVDSQVDPSVVGVMPYPEQGGATAYHYYGIYSGAGKRTGGAKRVDVCANMILDYASQFYVAKNHPDYLKYEKEYARRLVNYGYYNLCSYDELVAAGMEEYAQEIPPTSRAMQALIRDPKNYTFLPISEGYSRVQQEILSYVLLSRICTDRDYDIEANLKVANELANTQVFMKEELVQEKSRAFRIPLIAALALLVLLSAYIFYRLVLKNTSRTSPRVLDAKRISFGKRFASVLLLLPAVGLILIWAYYPLLRGSVMAFQDVHVLGDSTFVGLENFIRVLTNPLFPTVLKATLIYVFAVLTLGFFVPVILAILLSEVHRGSTLFRAIYYAPYLLGGVVVLFIWKIFYMPTADGLLNQVLAVVGWGPVRWLENPSINKWALAIPGIWAGAGSACLVYLAALKGIDEEVYEAADIDGAGALSKIFYITLPSLKPLLVINFVGAFIGAFHGMGNILVLTGGAFETNVIGLQIFFEAFGYLRFGSATALAWILGSLLIGFTIYQLSFLRKVEFRRAS